MGRVRSDSCTSCVEIKGDYYGDNGAKGPSEKRSSLLCRCHTSQISQITQITDHRTHKCHMAREAFKKILNGRPPHRPHRSSQVNVQEGKHLFFMRNYYALNMKFEVFTKSLGLLMPAHPLFRRKFFRLAHWSCNRLQ